MDSTGQVIGPAVRFPNNKPGAAGFIEELTAETRTGEYDRLRIATEATGWYWFHLFQTLSQDPTLQACPVELYAFNPRLTARYKETFGDLDKDDPTDAFVVADRLRMGRDLPPPVHGADQYLALRCLTRYHFWLSHQLAREKSYCLAMLYLKSSDYTLPAACPFSDVFGATSRAVIEEFASIEEIAAMPFEELVEFIDVKGNRRFANPQHTAQQLQQVAHDSYPLPEILRQPLNDILHLSLQHITFLDRQQKRLDPTIAAHLTAIPNTLQTIPGIGPVFAAGIIAEIGNLDRFEGDQAKVAKYAASNGANQRPGTLSPSSPPSPKNAIASYVTIFVRRPTSCGYTTATTPGTMTVNIPRFPNIVTCGPWC